MRRRQIQREGKRERGREREGGGEKEREIHTDMYGICVKIEMEERPV